MRPKSFIALSRTTQNKIQNSRSFGTKTFLPSFARNVIIFDRAHLLFPFYVEHHKTSVPPPVCITLTYCDGLFSNVVFAHTRMHTQEFLNTDNKLSLQTTAVGSEFQQKRTCGNHYAQNPHDFSKIKIQQSSKVYWGFQITGVNGIIT